ncbi:MAG: hypothetical protein ABJB66_05880 [Gemmatimonadaceae bacterium]
MTTSLMIPRSVIRTAIIVGIIVAFLTALLFYRDPADVGRFFPLVAPYLIGWVLMNFIFGNAFPTVQLVVATLSNGCFYAVLVIVVYRMWMRVRSPRGATKNPPLG